MKTLYFLLSAFFGYAVYAQPGPPQTTAFQPVALPGTQPASGNNPPVNKQQPGNGSFYQADVPRQAQRREYEELKADTRKPNPTPAISYALPSHAGEAGAEYYRLAYEQLNDMLTGKTPLSLKEAVFAVENAYMDNKLSYPAFDKALKDDALFCRLKLSEENTDTGNTAKNNMLFRLMSDTLTATDADTKKEITHYPLHYDFDDFYGEKDWTKMFVSKLMATGYGQCHSMPLLYRLVAGELGAKCYLSASPSHLFIKYKSGNELKNVELTNGHLTTDAYVMASGYIKSEALKNRLYLDTLSAKEEIARMMQDLGKGYYIKYGFDAFVLQCANTGLKYYPNDDYGMAIKSDYNTVLFQYVVSQKAGQTPEQVLSDPQALQLYRQMHAMYDALDNAGYAQIPQDAYEDWLRSIDQEKWKQEYSQFLQYQKRIKVTTRNAQ